MRGLRSSNIDLGFRPRVGSEARIRLTFSSLVTILPGFLGGAVLALAMVDEEGKS